MAKSVVKVQEVLELAEQKGLVVKEQKSFYRIVSKNENKKAIYVGRTKNGLTRVDYAGFTPPESKAIAQLTAEQAKELNMGAVRGQTLVKELRCSPETIVNAISKAFDCLLDATEGFKLGRKQQKVEEEDPKHEPFPALHLASARNVTE